MQRMSTRVRTLGIVGVCGLAALALPLPAHAGGVHVSVGFGLPWPVVVAPAPVVVARPTVVYTAPVVVYPAPVVVADPQEGYAPPAYGTSPCDEHEQLGRDPVGHERRREATERLRDHDELGAIADRVQHDIRVRRESRRLVIGRQVRRHDVVASFTQFSIYKVPNTSRRRRRRGSRRTSPSVGSFLLAGMILRERWGGWKRAVHEREPEARVGLEEADALYTWLTTTRPRMRMHEDLNVEIAAPIAEREATNEHGGAPQVGLGGDRRELRWYASGGRAGIKEDGDGW